uniref:IQ motif containing N n=1 Tax=Loxodonta africana TaxID=9785 RepID=G3UL50_LOXAF
ATPTGRVNPPRNQDNAASNTATAPRPDTTQQAELPPAPARPLSLEAEAQPSKPQHEATLSQQALEQQVAEEKLEPRRVPRLRTVVESQAFKNVLVDEMDMMMSRAATLIQASWRGHRLRQKLVSQMMAAKAIQEAWRRFNAKRILRSSKGPEKKVEEDKDIPYHPPQQVRFQQLLPEGQKPLPQGLPQPVMASKETQFPSVDSLVTCTPQQATQKLPEALGSLKPSIATSYVLGAPSVAFLPHQTIALRFPCPMHVDTKYQQPCLLTKTIRSSCLVHIEGETVKTPRSNSRHPPDSQRPNPRPRLTKTESQAQQVAQLTRTQIHTQTPTGMTKVQSQTRLVSGLNKTQFQAPVPPALTKGLSKTQLVTELAKETAKPLCPAHQAADLSKTESQPQLATAQSCQHLCTLGLLPHAKPDDRLTQLPAPSLALGKATQVPRLPGPDTQGMLVPLLAGHPSCNIESWGDGRAARAPSPTHSHPVLCPEEAGLTDTGVAGGQPWNAAGPGSMWQPARGMGSWDATATDSRRSGELLLSVHTVEELIIHAVVIIQAHVRGYLVRHMIKVWHRSATIIQALWRGHVVRKQLYRLHAAAQTIQAQWRGYHTRRDRCQQMLQPATWGMLGDWSRTSSGHRCFQSCQPRSCALCQTLCPGLGGPPSVVLLVGSSPRTCHMCGQTMPTRVVQGTGQGAGGQEGVPSQRGHGAQLAPCSPQLPHHHHKAATAIQSAWRGFLTRRHLRKQQVAAKRVQASWRGHFTRTCLTADALLGPRMAWDSPRHAQWPGV